MSITKLTIEDISEICAATKNSDQSRMCKKHRIYPYTVKDVQKNPQKYLEKFKPKKLCNFCDKPFFKKYNSLKLCIEHFDRATSQMLGGWYNTKME